MNDRHAEMAYLYQGGSTYQEIADKFGISRQRVGQILGKQQLARKQIKERRRLRMKLLKEAHRRILRGEATVDSEGERLGYSNLRATLHDYGMLLPRTKKKSQHGELLHYRRGCHCKKCAKANADRQRSLRGREPPNHGTKSGYQNYGCMCQPCRSAARADHRARKAARLQGKEAPQ